MLRGAPGRLERIDLGQPFDAYVDYAHSPDAVATVLSALRLSIQPSVKGAKGKLIAVLGCGGDRDTGKRPLMGSALLAGADVAIFTSDNPRSEDPKEIIKEMIAGNQITLPNRVEEDRSEAIRYAVSIADAGDTVVILGKGHEQGQKFADRFIPFDDRIELARAIESHGKKS
jgi:UDP-N-acetylmuramoyl-L-alanyl-D-glutamate--2,6-diaminopimelate ligase